ncbi:hypothetical protein [Staphylococcus schweitzeri]|nr:hypothetical protein [Staphylococcus schweitzeri]
MIKVNVLKRNVLTKCEATEAKFIVLNKVIKAFIISDTTSLIGGF